MNRETKTAIAIAFSLTALAFATQAARGAPQQPHELKLVAAAVTPSGAS